MILLPFLFALTLTLSAVLLFSVQPMIAKGALPLLGGAPAVWTTCMVFFQAALLAGYALRTRADRLAGDPPPGDRAHRPAPRHFALPADRHRTHRGVGDVPGLGSSPTRGLLSLLFLSAGVPFFAVATTAPLLQRWFAATGHHAAADPYFLYGASNFGSIAALLAYPLVIEPNIPLARQRDLWAVGYIVLASLIFACAVIAGRAATPAVVSGVESRGRPALTRWWRWVLLAFIPSSLMLGVTTYLSTDIAPMPLLWVIPLASTC